MVREREKHWRTIDNSRLLTGQASSQREENASVCSASTAGSVWANLFQLLVKRRKGEEKIVKELARTYWTFFASVNLSLVHKRD